MHYGGFTGSMNGKITIMPLQTGVQLKSFKTDEEILSPNDILGVKRMYECKIMSTTKLVTKPVTVPVTKPVTVPVTKPVTKPGRPVRRFKFTLINDLKTFVRLFYVNSSGKQVYVRSLSPGRRVTEYSLRSIKWKVKIRRQKNKKFKTGKRKFKESGKSYLISEI